MTLTLEKPDDPAVEATAYADMLRSLIEQVEQTREVCRRFLDSEVEISPGVPFASNRATLTVGQDDILGAERLARKRLKELEP